MTSERKVLCASALPMVTALVGFYGRRRSSLNADDLRSIGHYALVNAAATYDPARGDFERWAYVCVAKALLNALRKASLHASRERSLVDYFDALDVRGELDLNEALRSQDSTSRTWTVRDTTKRAVAAEAAMILSAPVDPEIIYAEHQTYAHAMHVLTTMEHELEGHLAVVFKMRFREAMRVGEIAAALEVSLATAYRYADAVKHLVVEAMQRAGLL